MDGWRKRVRLQGGHPRQLSALLRPDRIKDTDESFIPHSEWNERKEGGTVRGGQDPDFFFGSAETWTNEHPTQNTNLCLPNARGKGGERKSRRASTNVNTIDVISRSTL